MKKQLNSSKIVFVMLNLIDGEVVIGLCSVSTNNGFDLECIRLGLMVRCCMHDTSFVVCIPKC